MSCFTICDGDECTNTENDGVYHVDYETQKYLEVCHENSFGSSIEDICEDCIETINENYEKDRPLLIVSDGYLKLNVNRSEML